MTGAQRFDLAGDLPTGLAVLEASAGTGKTYTIAGLVARYVADGCPLTNVLVVTFTRAAAAELRDRIRSRLVAAVDHLERTLALGAAPATDDRALQILAAGPDGALRERLERLAAAVTDFDAATITTIHGFCQQALASLGVAGDADRAPVLLEDQRDLLDAVVDDVYLRAFHRDAPALTRPQLAEIARAVVGNPGAIVLPNDAGHPGAADEPDEGAARRAGLARDVAAELERRKRAAGLVAYDDLLTRLRATLRHAEHGVFARQRLRERYRVALIDEFQDTDPVQWEILSAAFGENPCTLVLIGDPKQAIYSFRGADVHAYLAAARTASQRGAPAAGLDVNWRSDGPLLDGLNALLEGAALGHDDIAYQAVEPAPMHVEARLDGAPDRAPVRLRIVRRDSGVRLQNDKVVAAAAREHIARDLAVDLVGLLCSDAAITGRDPDGTARPPVPVRPPDVAVLVRTNAEATLVQRTLLGVGVPAVITGVGSVFATLAATDWLRLLEALEQPSDRLRARAIALTAFFDWDCARVAAAGDRDWDGVHETLHRWAGVLRDRSVAALLRTITTEQDLPGRLLAHVGGERALTDLEHVGELLHRAVVTEELGATALAGWLRARIVEAADDANPDERSRRLESDAAAVQVVTVHGAKGLEYPIVYAPFLWSSPARRSPVPVCHDADLGGRVVDVAGGGDAFEAHQSDALAEARGEELRLLYVALTRARHQVVAWWAPVSGSEYSPLGRVLYCRGSRGVRTNARCGLPADDAAFDRLEPLVAQAPGRLSVTAAPRHDDLPRWEGGTRSEAALEAARFDRSLDHAWRRTSYSGITRLAHEVDRTSGAPGSEPDEPARDDEPPVPPAGAVWQPAQDSLAEAALRDVALPLSAMAGGTDVGTLVHAVFEHVDFAAGDLAAEVAAQVTEQRARRAVDLGMDDDAVADGLALALRTPLGPLAGGATLAGLSAGDRLDELAFELRLGGEDPRACADVPAIGALLRRHLRRDDPLHPYAPRLRDPALDRTLRGYLAGSIDVVVRLPAAGAPRRFAVVDYKTNRLNERAGTVTAWHYRPEALADAMMRAHYPLQALLYVVALHRYLRWRLRDYDPAVHLGPVLYLFVRGMVGPGTPRLDGAPVGVFAWQPPAALVMDLSDLLDQGRRAA